MSYSVGFLLYADDNAEDRTPRNPIDSKWSLPSNNPGADALFGALKLLISRFVFIKTSSSPSLLDKSTSERNNNNTIGVYSVWCDVSMRYQDGNSMSDVITRGNQERTDTDNFPYSYDTEMLSAVCRESCGCSLGVDMASTFSLTPRRPS